MRPDPFVADARGADREPEFPFREAELRFRAVVPAADLARLFEVCVVRAVRVGDDDVTPFDLDALPFGDADAASRPTGCRRRAVVALFLVVVFFAVAIVLSPGLKAVADGGLPRRPRS